MSAHVSAADSRSRLSVHGCTGVKRLQNLGMIPAVPGMAALDMNAAEDLVVANTRELVPGMVCPWPCHLISARWYRPGPGHACHYCRQPYTLHVSCSHHNCCTPRKPCTNTDTQGISHYAIRQGVNNTYVQSWRADAAAACQQAQLDRYD